MENIINHAEIRILFVGNQEQYEKALTLLGKSPYLKKIIVFDKIATIEKCPEVIYFDDLLQIAHQAVYNKEFEARLAKLDSEDLSTLIYTSEATCTPQAVMLTHKAWLAMMFATGYHVEIIETDINLAFLPLSQIFERAWSYFVLCGNAQLDYCHDMKALETFHQHHITSAVFPNYGKILCQSKTC